MKRWIILLGGIFIAANLWSATVVTSTIRWNTPWGDAWRGRAEDTIAATIVQLNINSAGTNIPLGSNTMFIGNAAGTAIGVTLSGDVVSTTAGVITIQPLAVTEGDVVLTEDEMLIGDGGTGTAVVISGDIKIPKTGVAVIQDLAVSDDDIALTATYLVIGDAGGTGQEHAVSGMATLASDGALTAVPRGTPVTSIDIADTKFIIGDGGGTGRAYAISSDVSVDNVGVATVADGAVLATEIGTGILANDVYLQPANFTASVNIGSADLSSATGLPAASIVGLVAINNEIIEIIVPTNTPAFAGQWMLGQVSNDVWLSSGTASSDWFTVVGPS